MNKKRRFPRLRLPRTDVLGLSRYFARPRLSLEEQMLFAKRMSFLVRSNIPILESLSIIRDQTKSGGARALYAALAGDIANGQFLSTGMARHTGAFSDFSLHVVRIGEMTGTLSKNLHYLADELYKRRELKKKILGAMAYPLFITVATVGLTGGLTAYIFPKIIPIFASLRVDLPLSTRILISVSDFIRGYGFIALFVAALCIVLAAVTVKRISSVRRTLHRVFLSLPLIGGVVVSYNMANACRTLGLLMKSGISVSEAFDATARATRNEVFKRSFAEVGQTIQRGERVSSAFAKSAPMVPTLAVHMTAVGEKTGALSDTFIYLGEFYESEVDELVKNLSSVLEPALMVLMGLLVGLVAVSVIAPIYEITQGLQR